MSEANESIDDRRNARKAEGMELAKVSFECACELHDREHPTFRQVMDTFVNITKLTKMALKDSGLEGKKLPLELALERADKAMLEGFVAWAELRDALQKPPQA